MNFLTRHSSIIGRLKVKAKLLEEHKGEQFTDCVLMSETVRPPFLYLNQWLRRWAESGS
jgi:hypothetical protein